MKYIKFFAILLLLNSFLCCEKSGNENHPPEEMPLDKEKEPDDFPSEGIPPEEDSEQIELPSINYEDNELEGTVAYRTCSGQEGNPLHDIQFPRGEVYLFKELNEQNHMYYVNACNDGYAVIIMESLDGVYIYLALNVLGLWQPVAGHICNFPDFAKVWDIPEYGCKVYIEGLSYIMDPYEGSLGHIPINYVLTTLKKIN